MAEETTQPAEQAAATDSPKRKGGLMALAKPLAFVSVIVLLEVVAASVLLPSAEATRDIGEQLAAPQVQSTIRPQNGCDKETAAKPARGRVFPGLRLQNSPSRAGAAEARSPEWRCC